MSKIRPNMQQQTYKIKNGEITLDEDKIVIQDNAKKQNRWRIISSSGWTFFGIMSILRYLNTGDQFLLWSGLFIGIGHLVILGFMLFRSSKSEVFKDEITSIELKQRMGNRFLDIKLKGNKIRRVNQVDNICDELQTYIDTNFKPI